MITKITSTEEFAQIFIENLLNSTNKISKVSDGSIIGATAQANGKIANLILKDIAIIESRMFPDTASGESLDEYAKREGFPARFGANGSSTFVRLVGTPGTTYIANTHFISGFAGVIFTFAQNVVIPSFGYCYARVSSTTTGANTNVDPVSLNKVNPLPAGHLYVLNEYAAIGGQDTENDENFRNRLIKGANILSRDTLAYYEQLLLSSNPRVLKLIHLGMNGEGKVALGIVSVDGGLFTNDELTDLTIRSEKYFSLRDYRPSGKLGNYGFVLQNANFQTLDFDFRVQIRGDYVSDDVRKEIQIALNKIYDFRFWERNRIEWDDALQTVKDVIGVLYVPDEYFKINGARIDIATLSGFLPRVRSFVMRDMTGNVIINLSGTVNPTYFTNQPDELFQSTIG